MRQFLANGGPLLRVLKGKKVPLGDGVDKNDVPNMGFFPYQADPHQGYPNSKATASQP